MDYEIMKAGWMHRQSSILRRWKKNWFVLYKNGKLLYFESPNSHSSEDFMIIPSMLLCVKTGKLVTSSNPLPPHLDRNAMIELVTQDKKWIMCAESSDDTRAWEIAIEEARVIRPSQRYSNTYPRQDQFHGIQPPPAYAELYNQPQIITYAGNEFPASYYMHNVNSSPYGSRQIYLQDPYRQRYSSSEVAMGVATGAVVGSMLWSPFMWWW